MTTENWIDLNDMQAVAIAQSEGWEIEVQTDVGNDKYCPFKEWHGNSWQAAYLYRGRPRHPKMKEVKVLCYVHKHNGLITYGSEGIVEYSEPWIRQPHLDMIAKVPE